MWDLGIGVIIGIYLGTYYDFRPVLESLMKWATTRLPPARLPPDRNKILPANQSLFAFFLTPKEK